MQKKIIIFVVSLILIATGFIFFNMSIETEYIPEIEIDEGNMRKTMVSLYFINNETQEIEKETRLIDSKELLKDPYKKVLNLLIEGPENERLIGIIPEGTTIKRLELEDTVLNIYTSKEFLKVFDDENKKDIAIETISNTLKEFKEINSINIIVDGSEQELES